MKKPLLLTFLICIFMCCLYGKSHAQTLFTDDFEDGDITTAPAWTGNTGNFLANNTSPVLADSRSVRTSTGTGVKSIASKFITNSTLNGTNLTWRLLYRNNTSATLPNIDKPAASNTSWRFWLATDGTNPATAVGFALIQKQNTLQLNRYTSSGVNTITSYSLPNNTSIYSIRVTRRGGDGQWELFVDTGTGEATSTRGTGSAYSDVVNGTQDIYMMLEANDNGSTANRFVFDNVSVTKSMLTVGCNTNTITTAAYSGNTYAFYSFQLTANEDVYLKFIYIFSSQNLTSGGVLNGNNISLVRSTDDSYTTTADNVDITSTITTGGGQAIVESNSNGSTYNGDLKFYNNNTTGITIARNTSYYYFVVSTVASPINTVPSPTSFFTNSTTSIGGVAGSFQASANNGYVVNSYTCTNPSNTVFANYIDWTGGSNTLWSNNNNWSPAQVPTSTDAVRIGVKSQTINGNAGFQNQPTVNDNRSCASLTLGIQKAVTLTVPTSVTLTVSGKLQQNLNTGNTAFANTLTGSGTISCSGVQVGDNTGPTVTGQTLLYSNVTALNVTNDIDVISNGSNRAAFTLRDGTVTLGGMIDIENSGTPSLANSAYFTINTANTGTFPKLVLNAANPISIDNPIYGSVNFYGDHGGPTTTTYNATNATVYTATTTGGFGGASGNLTGGNAIDLTKETYYNLVIQGGGTAKIGATNGTLLIDNDLTTSTTVDAFTNTTPITVGSVFTNTGTFTCGSAAFTSTGYVYNNTGGVLTTGSGTFTASSGLDNYTTFQAGSGAVTFGNSIRAYGGTMTFGAGTVSNANAFQLFNAAVVTCGTGTHNIAAGLETFNTSVFNAGAGPGVLTVSGTLITYNTSKMVFGSGNIVVNGAVTNANTVGSIATMQGGSGNIDFNGATFTNNGIFTLSGGTTTFAATTFTNATPGTFIASGGTVNFDRGGAQSIINTNTTTPVTFKDLTFSVSGTKTINPTPASQTGKFNVNNTGTITLSGTATVAAGDGFLTLKSGANSTARVAQLTSTNNTISGNVNVERWFTGGAAANRGWRLMSSPVNNSFNTQLATATTATTAAFNFSSLKTNMLVTGAGGSGQGFDQPGSYTANGPTILFYTQLSTGSGSRFDPLASIISTKGVGNGFYFYFRGDRTNATAKLIRTGSNPYPAPEANVVGLQTGYLNQQSFRYALGNTGRKFNLVGNPYPSSIAIPAANMVNTTGWIYTFAPGGNSIGTGSPAAAVTLASGQGFFVVSNNANPYINFTESLKTATQPTGASLLMGTPVDTEEPMITLKMIQDDNNWDISYLRFLDSYKDDFYDMEDAEDFDGPNQATLFSALTSDKKLVAVASQPLAKQRTSVFLSVDDTATGIYKIQKTGLVGIPAEYDVYLMDHFKKDSLDLRANDTYNFNLDKSNPATFGTERFEVVIRKKILPDYKLVSFTGKKAGTNVTLRWDTKNEFDYTSFELQKSTDNKTFDAVRNSRSTSSGTYTYTDNFLATDTQPIYYRLKQTDIYDRVSYSKVVIIVTNGDGKLSLYPNPASNSIQFVLSKPIKSKVNLRIYNAMGILVKTGTFASETGQQDISSLTTGSYTIEIVDASTKEAVLTGKFVKL